MRQKILKMNKDFHFFNDFIILDHLEVGFYDLCYDKSGCFLRECDPPSLPKKFYNVDEDFRKIVLKSFNHYNKNLGVLLEGEKGTGKSFNANKLCLESKLPVIKVNSSIPNSVDFISFLNSIGQEYVLLIDEFDKKFPLQKHIEDGNERLHDQKSLLGFLDGQSSLYKKLVILTSNEKSDYYLMNRPGRILYHKMYKGMSLELIREVLDTEMGNSIYKEDLISSVSAEEMTMDILLAIIREILVQERPYSSFKTIFNFSEIPKYYSLYSLSKNNEKKFLTGGLKINQYCIENIDCTYPVSNFFRADVINHPNLKNTFKPESRLSILSGGDDVILIEVSEEKFVLEPEFQRLNKVF